MARSIYISFFTNFYYTGKFKSVNHDANGTKMHVCSGDAGKDERGSEMTKSVLAKNEGFDKASNRRLQNKMNARRAREKRKN